jgi:signal transduction histidine kinase
MVEALPAAADSVAVTQWDDRASPLLSSRGKTASLIASIDWNSTSLGSSERWPTLLKQMLQFCLDARLPLALAWGPRRTLLCNDLFLELCAGQRFDAVGQAFHECWASAWPVLAPHFERAWRGESCHVEDAQLFLDRNGRLEESFLTFAFTPLRAEDGAVLGVLQSVHAATAKVLATRRSILLAEIVVATAAARSVREALVVLGQVLDRAALDVPFALVYRVEPTADRAELVSRTSSALHVCSPPCVDWCDGTLARWPIAEVVRSNQGQLVTHLEERFGSIESGPYVEPVTSALVLPVTPVGSASPVAVLIAGLSPRLVLDTAYRAFFEQLVAALASTIGSVRAHDELRGRAEQLSALDRAKMVFFSNISHEFRTPLTLLAGPLEDELSEREAPLPSARLERLQTAHRNTLRLIKLVNSWLDFSRIEAGRAIARYQATQVGTLTSELVSMFRSAVERAGLTLEVEIGALPEPIFVDREMWEKIVLNLMSNAFKHTVEGGIRVRLRCLPDAVELSVADTGIGIAAHELPLLFERYHRVLGAQSRTHEGSGIGLALVRELSRLHGGDVRVSSEVGKGSTFTIVVPRGHAHLAAEQIDADSSASPTGAGVAAYVQEALQWSRSQVAASPPSALALDGRESSVAGAPRPKILLADDNADLRDYVSGLLERSYEVVAVPDGQAALDVLPSVAPDLVLTDLMMPRLDGIGLLRALRADARIRHIPVILLSARAGEESDLQSGERGPDDYLVKPFSARELIARVRTHVDLSRVRRERIEQLEQANQELEAFSYSVSHDLRTPLRAIDGFSNAILTRKADQLDEEGKQYLARVRRATTRMGELIDELLRLSRVSRSALTRQPVPMTALAEKVARALRESQPTRQVHFEVQRDLVAHADPRLLQIVLENLFDNSWKFTGRQSTAEVRLGEVATAAVPTYFVMDNGAGFDQTFVHRLFQPFQRLHSDGEFPGTGIGLAIVHRIIVRHGGRIWAESSENKGATFYFTLTGKT